MKNIKLLCARNLITRRKAVAQQQLSFLLLVENRAFEKTVEVAWAGEDGAWHHLPAHYHGSVDHDKEYWFAQAAFVLTAEESLPGNIRFAVRYRVSGAEYWDNNLGENYSIEADSGIMLARDTPILNAGFESGLTEGAQMLPVVVAVDADLKAERVTIHWTHDNWGTSRKSACGFARDYWSSEFLSNARNPNQYGCQIWHGALTADDAFRVRYKISCEAGGRVYWDDNFGESYGVQRRLLKVLILNLHCYQEENQDYKLSQIAKAIGELDVDIVCLQEVAERWNDGRGDWDTNSARIINERLASPYHLVTDWSHLGFDRYREGVAVLSRYPILKQEGRYVSSSQDPYSIHSRKVVMARIRVPHAGLINVFSSHLSWWEDGFSEQFQKLRSWAADEHRGPVAATMLCGDFNIKAGSKGYQLVVESNEYDDQFLAANEPEKFRAIFGERDAHWRRYLDDDHRIDYVFLRKASELAVTAGQDVFTEKDYGRVSDHCGYLMTFKPK